MLGMQLPLSSSLLQEQRFSQFVIAPGKSFLPFIVDLGADYCL